MFINALSFFRPSGIPTQMASTPKNNKPQAKPQREKCHYTITHYTCSHREWSSSLSSPPAATLSTYILQPKLKISSPLTSPLNTTGNSKNKITHHPPCLFVSPPNSAAKGSGKKCTNMALKPKEIFSQEICGKCKPPAPASPPLPTSEGGSSRISEEYEVLFKDAFAAAAGKDGGKGKGKERESRFVEDLPPVDVKVDGGVDEEVETKDLKGHRRGWVDVRPNMGTEGRKRSIPEVANGAPVVGKGMGFLGRLCGFGGRKEGKGKGGESKREGDGVKKGESWSEVQGEEGWPGKDGEWEALERVDVEGVGKGRGKGREKS